MAGRNDSELRALLFKHKHKVEREQTESENSYMILNPIPAMDPQQGYTI